MDITELSRAAIKWCLWIVSDLELLDTPGTTRLVGKPNETAWNQLTECAGNPKAAARQSGSPESENSVFPNVLKEPAPSSRNCGEQRWMTFPIRGDKWSSRRDGPRRLPMADTTIDFEPKETRNTATKRKKATIPAKTNDTAAVKKLRFNNGRVQPETPAVPSTAAVTSDAKPARAKKANPAKVARGMSALDAGAKVQCDAGTLMALMEMIASMSAKGYWTSGGGRRPTPRWMPRSWGGCK